jgi:hypothetical protein
MSWPDAPGLNSRAELPRSELTIGKGLRAADRWTIPAIVSDEYSCKHRLHYWPIDP